MNPTEKLTIMVLIYLVSGMEAHNLPVTLKNILGAENDQAKKTYLLHMLEERLRDLDEYDKYIESTWKKHKPEFDDEY